MSEKYKYVVNSDEWEEKANRVARSIVDIGCCVQCGSPVVKGYCCNSCGSGDPSGTKDERDTYYNWVFEQRKK